MAPVHVVHGAAVVARDVGGDLDAVHEPAFKRPLLQGKCAREVWVRLGQGFHVRVVVGEPPVRGPLAGRDRHAGRPCIRHRPVGRLVPGDDVFDGYLEVEPQSLQLRLVSRPQQQLDEPGSGDRVSVVERAEQQLVLDRADPDVGELERLRGVKPGEREGAASQDGGSGKRSGSGTGEADEVTAGHTGWHQGSLIGL
jgi:hypothetical protein